MTSPLRRFFVAALGLFVALAGSLTLAQENPDEPRIDFARDVQPILARRCFSCHGPDEAEGGLRLHDPKSALGELDSGEIGIVPGKPEASELIARITAEDESMRMPPEGKPLTPAQIDTLRRWIAQGAKYQSHWAFQKPERPAIPAVKQKEWVANPIDAFVLAKLEARGLKPSPPADKLALVRRLYYDLTGLPPTFEEAQAFVQDPSEDAYERLVDKLLDSPRYGERWARHWLDVVRFAETNSFERDGRKPHAWRYRDYVIRSFNEDKPYDQFIREQLAGDELPNPTSDSIIATGYYRLGLWDDEPADRELAKFDGYDDLVTTTSQAFLGLTVNCARCHDHKIDPIPAKDYYSMVAFFRGVTSMSNGGPQIEKEIFTSPEAKAEYEAAVKRLEEQRNQVQAKLAAIEQQYREKSASLGGSDLDDLQYRFYRDTFTSLPDFDNLKPETVDRVPSQRFDLSPTTRDDNYGFVFTGFLKVPQDAEYTFTLDSDDGARLTIDGKMLIEYDGIHGVGNPKTAKVALKAGRVPVRLDYFQGGGGRGLEVSWSGPGFDQRMLSAEENDLTVSERRQRRRRGSREPGSIARHVAGVLGKEASDEYNQLVKELERLKRETVPVDKALYVSEVGTNTPDTHILLRGSPQARGEKVEPAFLEVLGGGKAEYKPRPDINTSGRRTALANWIASPDNYLTSRVMVNRIWQHHFGRGIVRSPNNFGLLGDPPTHPELLDYLATEFVQLGWRMKPLHKLILMSNTYRQSSRGNPEALAVDPANDLFWRYNMRRLSAEELRDSVHAVNGRLNLKMYGPGFYPEISEEVLKGQSMPGSGWGNSPPEERARRSIYIHVKRSLVTPLLSAFDFPDTDITCEARFNTTQPGQALALLNGEFMNQQAVAFAERLKREAGDDTKAQVARAIQVALSRAPRDKEIERGLALIENLQKNHGQSAGDALNHYCLFVLNLNEFMYLD